MVKSGFNPIANYSKLVYPQSCSTFITCILALLLRVYILNQPVLIMVKEDTVTRESFHSLLGWLDLDQETAGQKYEKIRQRLIRVFAGRGCFEAEELADETISRVALKLSHIVDSYTGEPGFYFYGVANKIYLEWLRKQKRLKKMEPSIIHHQNTETDSEIEYKCLEDCMKTLPERQREFIIEYYQGEKSVKIRHRKQMRKNLGISETAFQVKASRIRRSLKKCVIGCVAENGA